jgi:hypothetical protein
MHSITGCYDTAARETATMNPAALFPEGDRTTSAKPASPTGRARKS